MFYLFWGFNYMDWKKAVWGEITQRASVSELMLNRETPKHTNSWSISYQLSSNIFTVGKFTIWVKMVQITNYTKGTTDL